MQDKLGLFYYPQANNHKVRVYVRRQDGVVEFRLWQDDLPEVWERHGWIPYRVLQDAAQLYREERNADADPLRIYDINVAELLLREAEQ